MKIVIWWSDLEGDSSRHLLVRAWSVAVLGPTPLNASCFTVKFKRYGHGVTHWTNNRLNFFSLKAKQSQIRGDFIVLLDHAGKAIKKAIWHPTSEPLTPRWRFFFQTTRNHIFILKFWKIIEPWTSKKSGQVLCIDKILEYLSSEKAFLSKLCKSLIKC